MFKIFVLITGILNFPIGLGVIGQALLDPRSELFAMQTAAGAFILFAGAALVWASRDLNVRAPIVVWSGFVRCVGFAVVIYTAIIATVPTEQLAIAGMDIITALVYFVGSPRHTGVPFTKLLVGRTK